MSDWLFCGSFPAGGVIARALQELTVSIPLRAGHCSKNIQRGRGTGRDAQPVGQVKPVSILLADDHPHFPRLVQNLLRPPFEVVGSVHDGQSLIRTCSTLRPQIVVTDISMPVLNGIDAVRQLLKSGSSSKFIFLTVHTDPDFVRACFATGALGYVIKTKIVSDLLIALDEILEGRTFVSPVLSESRHSNC